MENHFTDEETERIGLIRHKLKFVADRPAVLCLEGVEPPVSAGAAIAEMIRVAGGVPVPDVPENTGRPLMEEDWQHLNPGIFMLMPAGTALSHTLQKMGELLGKSWFKALPAVKNNRVYLIDGQYGSQGNPQMTADHIELFAEIINPGDFHFGLEGKAWMRFNI